VKDKDIDRRAACDETHRSALRAAYVDFIAASSNFVDSAGVLIARMSVIEALAGRLLQEAPRCNHIYRCHRGPKARCLKAQRCLLALHASKHR
jgi:hypothetical protein